MNRNFRKRIEVTAYLLQQKDDILTSYDLSEIVTKANCMAFDKIEDLIVRDYEKKMNENESNFWHQFIDDSNPNSIELKADPQFGELSELEESILTEAYQYCKQNELETKEFLVEIYDRLKSNNDESVIMVDILKREIYPEEVVTERIKNLLKREAYLDEVLDND